jgi:hypothetical protein
MVAALGAALSIWGLARKFSRSDKLVYSRELADGETLRIKMRRGDAVDEDLEI